MATVPPPLPDRHRPTRIVRRILLFTFVTGVLLFCGYHLYLWAKIQKHYRQLRAAGVPLTYEECTRDYERIKLGSNTAGEYQTVFNLLTNLNRLATRDLFGRSSELGLGALKLEDRSYLEATLQENQAAYNAAWASVPNGTASYPLVWSDGMGMILKHFQGLKALLQLTQIHSLLALHDSDKEAVLRDISMVLKVSESLAEEPVTVSLAVRMGGHQSASRILEILLNRTNLQTSELSRLSTLFASIETKKQLQGALSAERVMVNDVFHHPVSTGADIINDGASPSAGTTLGILAMRLNGAWKDDNLFALEMFRTLETANSVEPQPFLVSEFVAHSVRLEHDRISKAMQDHSLARTAHRIKLVSAMLLPGSIKLFQQQILNDATLRVTRTGIALAQFIFRHAHPPDQLGELVPEFLPAVPTDPFTGRSLQFKHGKEKCVVYSLGPDQLDDSGIQAGKLTADSKGDISFTVKSYQ